MHHSFHSNNHNYHYCTTNKKTMTGHPTDIFSTKPADKLFNLIHQQSGAPIHHSCNNLTLTTTKGRRRRNMGYPTDIFTTKLADGCICPICHDIVRDASSMKECGLTFCDVCIKTSLSLRHLSSGSFRYKPKLFCERDYWRIAGPLPGVGWQ